MRIVIAVLLVSASIPIVRQYGGWNFEAEYHQFNQSSRALVSGTPEDLVYSKFSRVPENGPPYTIGVVATTDHQPVFGGSAYRVIDLGYYDFDGRGRLLAHVICERDTIRQVYPVRAGIDHPTAVQEHNTTTR